MNRKVKFESFGLTREKMELRFCVLFQAIDLRDNSIHFIRNNIPITFEQWINEPIEDLDANS